MIHVSRSGVKPAILTGDDSAGKRERARATAFFDVRANRLKKFPGDFKVYKEKEVKLVLNELFHGKCAYCESIYSQVHPVDVEHFRPKAAVAHQGELRKPGYYWLAAEWTNLFPSCIDCNRERWHPAVDQSAEPELSGKANWFPITNEAQRAEYPDQEQDEVRELLDPCRDRPDDHLSFRKDDFVDATSAKGQTSIDVLGLNRPGLVRERGDVRLQVKNQMTQTTKALKRAKKALKPAKRKKLERRKGVLANNLLYLLWFARDSRPYAAMVRQILERYVDVMAGKLRESFIADVPATGPAGATVDAFADLHGTVDRARPVLATSDPVNELANA